MDNTCIQLELEERYRSVKGRFVICGSTLNSWSTANGGPIQNVKSAFMGKWKGPKATVLINAVLTNLEQLEK